MDGDNAKCVYLDYNGTTPVHPAVLDAMLPYLTEHFGNPSSSHRFGREPAKAVRRARHAVLRLVRQGEEAVADDGNPDPASAIVFTGCGTEANNMAIRLSLLASRHRADERCLHVVSTNVEHPAIVQCLESYAADGGLAPRISVTYVPVDGEGLVSVADVAAALRPHTALVSVMTANNEVGSVQPVRAIAALCRERRVLFHTDAAQAVGKVDLRGLADPTTGADLVTIVGHKFGAPKGVAALYVRHGCLTEHGRVDPEGGGSVLLMGGGQEGGRRGGTENVPYIVGMGRAAERLLEERPAGAGGEGWRYDVRRMEAMRLRLLRCLADGCEAAAVRVNGPADPARRLPNTLSVSFEGVRSGDLLAAIGDAVACSAGAACHAPGDGGLAYSAVLEALAVPPAFALGTLRLSVGPDTSEKDVDLAAKVILEEVKRQLLGE